MTDTPTTYSLVPWVRRGLASLITNTPATNYASLPVAMAVNNAGVPVPALRLLGPGDVTGLDPGAVIRTDPCDGADAFEPNYLAMVELGLPDLPWLFTPAAPSAGRLRPWICLVVVPQTDGVSVDVRGDGVQVLRIAAPLDPRTELPDLAQIDFWAHAQVIGDNLSDVALAAAFDGNPAARLSRLIAARRLEPGRRYHACVVPTYRAGVNAGLRLPVDAHDLALAWDATTTAPLVLPIYYHFSFQTGPGGDFASLAARIVPPVGPFDAGTRPMDVSAPGFGAAAAPGLTLGLEGALRTIHNQPTAWPSPEVQATFEHALRQVLAPPAAPDPVVAPPVYGQAQTGAGLPADSGAPSWQRELNLDPRTRVAASAGAQVVRRDQEALIASAWDQLGEIRKANQLLRQAQLGRHVSASLGRRHLDSVASDGGYLQITTPVHGRVQLTAGSATLRGAMEASLLPPSAMSPALRTLARPRGPLGRRLQAGVATPLVERLNLAATGDARALRIVAPSHPPLGMIALDDVSPVLQVAQMTPAATRSAHGWQVLVRAGTPTGPAGPVALLPVGSPAPHVPNLPDRINLPGPVRIAWRPVDWLDGADAPPWATAPVASMPPLVRLPLADDSLAEMQASFRAAAAVMAAYVNGGSPSAQPSLPPLGGAAGLKATRAVLAARLQPAETLRARVAARIPLASGPDPLQPLAATPTFPQAMYRPLAEFSPEWLLPGISRIPRDTAALLVPNPRFVASFMIGLNEELARELLWREVPVAPGGTYFQTFWGATVAGVPAPDIAPIATFPAASHLGDLAIDHAPGASLVLLVLLVRAELFRRYPNAVVAAVRAVWNPDNKTRGLGADRRLPIFRGEIGTDVTFFGFELDDAIGSDDPAAHRPGWYFVIEQHLTEPRFGLEPAPPRAPAQSWNDLAWTEVSLDRGYLAPGAMPSQPTRESVTWGGSAADMAFILMRRPVRVAFHARALIGGSGT